MTNGEVDDKVIRDSVQVFNVYSDPEEKVEISKTEPRITEDLIKSFNEHWKGHPKQFDWAISCFNDKRYKWLPQSECDKRTSHLPWFI